MGFNKKIENEELIYTGPITKQIPIGAEDDLDFSFRNLKGQKKDLLDFILRMRSVKDRFVSKKLSKSEISKSTGIPAKNVGEVVKRLVQTGLVSIHKGEVGVQGNRSFLISSYVIEQTEQTTLKIAKS